MTGPINYKILPQTKFGTKYGLRPDTKLHSWVVNFIFNEGGMGDFVNYSAATKWIAEHVPWVKGRLFAPRYLVPLMKIIHADFPDFQIFPSEEFVHHMEEQTSMVGPGIIREGVNITPQLLNCLGSHHFDVGFAYYISTTPPPEGAVLPILDFPKESLIEPVRALDRYVVIPVGATAKARTTSGKHLNPLIDHAIGLGLTPVFLGKTDLLCDGKASTTFANDIHYHKGMDLRDKTTVVEAACIMQHAVATMALDCGLLHLAALMKDSNIVFGYNITTIQHREPRRKHGKTINLTITEKDLICIGCQSKMKIVPVHRFDNCLYGDAKCIDLLFADKAKKWTDALDTLAQENSQLRLALA